MKLNEKYDLYIDDDYVIYYWNKRLDKLMQRTIYKTDKGYLLVNTKIGAKCVHRIIYETFIGEIPDGYEIDHIKGNRMDNRPEMLKCVTHKENMNNPITRKRISEVNSESLKGNTNAKGNTNTKGKPRSEFGRKFKDHFGIARYQNPKLYHKELQWYRTHNNKCKWETRNEE